MILKINEIINVFYNTIIFIPAIILNIAFYSSLENPNFLNDDITYSYKSKSLIPATLTQSESKNLYTDESFTNLYFSSS